MLAATYYTRPTGTELISIHQLMSRSDTVDVAFTRYSGDNGRTWTLVPRCRRMGLIGMSIFGVAQLQLIPVLDQFRRPRPGTTGGGLYSGP